MKDSRRSGRARLLLTLALSAVAVFATAGVANAATITFEDGALEYTSADGVGSFVEFEEALTPEEAPTGNYRFDSSSDPVTNLDGSGCTDVTPDEGTDGSLFTCDGVTSIYFDMLDGDDGAGGFSITAPIQFDGGEGDDETGGPMINDDTINGGPGVDTLRGGPGNDTMRGGAGNDERVVGGPGNDNVNGDAGDDYVGGGPGADTVNGGDGNDEVAGCNTNAPDGPGCWGVGDDADLADTVNGGAGNDDLYGEFGNDTLNGGPDNDYLEGGEGNDVARGDGGNDYFAADDVQTFLNEAETRYTYRDPGNDTYVGGTGIDEISYMTNGYDNSIGDVFPIDVRVSQDGLANDGQTGENDNVGSDIEDIYTYGWSNDPADNGTSTITAAGGFNSIGTADGDDVVNPGAGNDFVWTRGGDDVINARDGFADRIDCGDNNQSSVMVLKARRAPQGAVFNPVLAPDNDVANVDQFDIVADNCETVNRSNTDNANDDAPPTVQFTSPATNGGTLENGTVLAANASDNQQVTQVVFLAGTRILCVDTSAPYTCEYTKTAADVGKATLLAVAYDNLEQTATDIRFVDVKRFRPTKLGSKARPKSDTEGNRRFTVRGKLTLPTGVSPAEGCNGNVTVRFKSGKKTISSKQGELNDECRYRVRRTFSLPERFDQEKLRVLVRFEGNDVLRGRKAKTKKVTVLD